MRSAPEKDMIDRLNHSVRILAQGLPFSIVFILIPIFGWSLPHTIANALDLIIFSVIEAALSVLIILWVLGLVVASIGFLSKIISEKLWMKYKTVYTSHVIGHGLILTLLLTSIHLPMSFSLNWLYSQGVVVYAFALIIGSIVYGFIDGLIVHRLAAYTFSKTE